ncbi:MAG: hypothetical protein HQ546_00035, partial [Planctomycetes bacterium]|nr:hypothetical protein [Planctomycetota bacterium]
GITGSIGKSTTAAMTAAVAATSFNTHLGGNIGRSLLEDAAEQRIRQDHVVVLELSSFQLARTPLVGLSPQVALVTNLQANHLDRHATMDEYAQAKKNIFLHQRPEDLLIVNSDDPLVWAWVAEAPGRTDTFDSEAEPFELAVPGRHNQINAQAAWAVGRALGVSRRAAAAALKVFSGLPNRLALVAERDGVRYYDDSKATTPVATIAAVNSFSPEHLVVIVGGYDKHIPLAQFCEELAVRCKTVVATGQVGPEIAARVRQCVAHKSNRPSVVLAEQFDRAVAAATASAQPGDVVLLSPACASYDQFPNYIYRGRRFLELVQAGR